MKIFFLKIILFAIVIALFYSCAQAPGVSLTKRVPRKGFHFDFISGKKNPHDIKSEPLPVEFLKPQEPVDLPLKLNPENDADFFPGSTHKIIIHNHHK